jgi:hypothetical protein
MQSNKPTQNRFGLTRTQSLILIVLGIGVCLVFGIVAMVLINAMATPAAPSVAVEPQVADATATPIPVTPTPTLVPAPVLEEGWTVRGHPGDGFTMAMPDTWIELDVNAETLDAALAPVREYVPGMENPGREEWTTEAYRNKGFKLAAIDVQGSGHVYYPGIDVVCDELEETVSLDKFVQEIVYSYPDLGVGILANERVILAVGEAERIELVYGAADPLKRVQYLLLKDKAYCFATFTWDINAGDAYVPIADKIIQTFRWAE